MPKTKPLPDWTGEDVYLIGGGPSLRGFDWNQLKALNVVGCNQAFRLGPEVCHVCMFGDYRFWESYCLELEIYGGWVATNYLTMNPPNWLKFYERQDEGLDREKVAWNGNTGAAAINLALILGAARVLLLGYDLGGVVNKPLKDESHWHDGRLEVPTPAHYERFASGFQSVANALPVVFPKRTVVNVSNGASALKCFPIAPFQEVGLR